MEAEKGNWMESKIKYYDSGKISRQFKEIVIDGSVTTLPSRETGTFIDQGDFNMIIWKNNRAQ